LKLLAELAVWGLDCLQDSEDWGKSSSLPV
jgi:hypothetical protein